jgi:hypothetical protein
MRIERQFEREIEEERSARKMRRFNTGFGLVLALALCLAVVSAAYSAEPRGYMLTGEEFNTDTEKTNTTTLMVGLTLSECMFTMGAGAILPLVNGTALQAAPTGGDLNAEEPWARYSYRTEDGSVDVTYKCVQVTT